MVSIEFEKQLEKDIREQIVAISNLKDEYGESIVKLDIKKNETLIRTKLGYDYLITIHKIPKGSPYPH